MTLEETKQIQNVVVGFPEIELPNIQIEFIDHNNQRYETCGDYFYDDVMKFKISKTKPHYQFLIMIHELIEWYLVHSSGMSIEEIDKFDERFEKMRSEYPDIVGNEEPGDNDNAPYTHYHKIASRVERWLADTLHVDFSIYNSTINELKQNK